MQKSFLLLLHLALCAWEPELISVEDVDIPEANAELNLMDGDIRREFENSHGRSTINDKFYRWKLPIPIALSSGMNLKTRGEYKQAMIEYSLRTCIPFKDWEGEADYLSIYPMSGCWSYVGHVYPNQQNVSIQQPGCDWSATIEHELMHALGIYHEQSRPDRDDYVFIDEEQVTDGHVHNFNKYDFEYVSPVGTEYAYDSIMHYGPYSFNKDPEIPTIYPRIKYFLDVIGQRKTFSHLDATRINRLYNCSEPVSKTFNCNFNLMNICGFVNEDGNQVPWTQFDVKTGKNVGGANAGMPPTDASQHVTDPGRYLYADGGSASLISRVFEHDSSPDQCVIIWTWLTSGKITVEFWSAESKQGEKDEKQDEFEIFPDPEREGKWQFTQYNYRPMQSTFKVRVVYEGTGFAAIDDLSIQETACRPNYFIIDRFSERLNAAKAAVEGVEDPSVIEENKYWSPVMKAPSGHAFQIQWIFVSKYNSKYSSAYLHLHNSTNDDDSLFWPWVDQFYKIFVRDRDPNVHRRMDQHTSIVALESDNNWNKPEKEKSGGMGRGNFMSHFDVLTNQHGYFSKDDEIYVQVLIEDYRNLDTSSKLDSCEPCWGERAGERVCKWDEQSGKSFCGCSDPLILTDDNECVCPPGFIYDETQTLREVCKDVCHTNYCLKDQNCIQTEQGAVCVDKKPEVGKKFYSKFMRDAINDDAHI